MPFVLLLLLDHEGLGVIHEGALSRFSEASLPAHK